MADLSTLGSGDNDAAFTARGDAVLAVSDAAVVATAWGTPHPWVGTRLNRRFVLTFGPRDAAEVETMASIVAASHTYATAD